MKRVAGSLAMIGLIWVGVSNHQVGAQPQSELIVRRASIVNADGRTEGGYSYSGRKDCRNRS